ncbi:MAG TPA: Uma2 family endonuclease [Thermoanaerobaculia bacterium]|nr:Uma2 family endonuclease [Thermoanaerobaculia bacterium]
MRKIREVPGFSSVVSSKRNLPMAVAAVDVHRWTREDYERMAAEGYFAPDARVELVDGVVYDMSPQKGPHTTCLHLALHALTRLFPDAYVRVQSPLALSDDSEPEPDLAVVRGTVEDYANEHPTTALLVVEVADSSLAHDAGTKIPLYARCRIPEAWLLDVKAKILKVHRDPVEGLYQAQQVLRTGDTVSPLARREARISVAAFFPKDP